MKRSARSSSRRRDRGSGERPGSVRHALADIGVRPSKERGQNFIINPAVLDAIVGFSGIEATSSRAQNIIEIGPGLGALTEKLIPCGKLTVIEIEDGFATALEQKHGEALNVIHDDVRNVPFADLGANLTVFGNLPYSFSTDIVFHLIDQSATIERAILLLQREFAERLAAAPGSRAYGLLSVSCQMMCDTRLGPIIEGNSFHPPTKVQSRLIELRFLKSPRIAVPDILWFKRVVAAAFVQRRRMIHNSLVASGLAGEDVVQASLAAAGITPNRRAETVSLAEFANLAAALPRPV